MSNQERHFKVYDKDTDEMTDVVGVAALAKHLDRPVEEIPSARMLKVTYGQKTVIEPIAYSS